MSIAPGTTITIELIARPTSAAAEKTIRRLLLRDAAARRRQRARKSKRPSLQQWRRGNNTWHHQMRSEPPVRVEPGARGTLRATLDVLRDLAGVERFVKVTSA